MKNFETITLTIFILALLFASWKLCIPVDTAYTLLAKPFNKIEGLEILFPKKHARITELAEVASKNFKKEIDSILKVKEHSSCYANTFEVLDEASRKISATLGIVEVLEMLSPHKKIRAVCSEKKITLNNLLVDRLYSKELFKILKAYATKLFTNKVDQGISEEKRYFVKRMIEELESDGLSLPDEAFEQFKQTKKNLIKLCSIFDKNINEANITLSFTAQELEGVSADTLKKCDHDEQDNYLVKLDAPTFTEIIENCKVAPTREKCYREYNSRAWPDNEKLFNQILQERAKLAKILSLQDFATYDLKLMMAKSPDVIRNFLNELISLAKPKMLRELKALKKNLPEGVELDENGNFKLSDITFVSKIFRETNFDLDENLLKEYFPLNATISGIFKVYQDLLGLTFKLHKNIKLWHPDTSVIEVLNTKTGSVQGYIILDLFPRDNKYSHACMAGIISTIKKPGAFHPAVCVVVANLPRATKDLPALLKFPDVKTFFHEFGHAMHQVLGSTQTKFFSGTQVLWDFVETPSQMFEEWLWESDVLKNITSHYRTGETIPDELIERLIASRNYNSGYWIARQANFAHYSLECHSNPDGEVDLQSLWKTTFAENLPGISPDMGLKSHASWGHLSGYSAKYYTYLWSLVFATDLFVTAKELGLENEVTGQKIRSLLSQGGSVEPEILLEKFLHRKPSLNALARRRELVS